MEKGTLDEGGKPTRQVSTSHQGREPRWMSSLPVAVLGGRGGGQPAACLPFPGLSLPLTHNWNVPDSPGPEFSRSRAFRPWDDEGIPVLFSPRNNGEHGR